MALNPNSIQLDGVNFHAKLSTSASIKNLSAFTWMAWVKMGSISKNGYDRAYVERQGTGAGIRFALVPIQGRLRFEFSPKDGTTDTNYDYLYTWDDRWHHVAFAASISGSNPTYKIYVDGVRVAEGSTNVPAGTTAVSNTTPLGGSIYVGKYSLHTSGGDVFSADKVWDGKIDDILIFDEVKNDGDILTYFTSNDHYDHTADTNCIVYWRFNEGSGSSTVNTVTPAQTGTLYSNNVASASLWTIDRPFLGNGTVDTTIPSTPGLPGTPTTNITTDGFTATWTGSTDNVWVQFYELNVSLSSGFGAYTPYNVGTDLSKAVTGLLPGTNYFWRVSALDAEGNRSGFTATQSLTTTGSGDVSPPNPPTALNATSITHSSYTLNFTQSSSSDEAGYKLDVATDPSFTNFLTNYVNRDIGNVVTVAVLGTQPLTTYYNRLRAYDAALNESVDSSVLIVQTPSRPDITPPSVIETTEATSITSNAFNANWLEGEDDVGIVTYYLDVSTASDFSSFVTGNGILYQNYEVGDTTSHRVEGLTKETGYFYRTRGADAAGNISANAAVGENVSTLPSNVNEGGFVETVFETTADAWTNSANTSQNNGTDVTLYSVGNGSANTRATFLLFDLTTVVGTLQSVMLRLFVTEASAATHNIRVDNVTFNEGTINWSNQPAVGGSAVTFVPLNVSQWIEVDITSLFIDGLTTYTVKIDTISTDQATFASGESANIPQLIVESDPSNFTMLDTMTFDDDDGLRKNWFKNPDFVNNVTDAWTQTGTVTRTRDTADPFLRTATMKCAFTAVSGNRYVNTIHTDAPTVQGDTWTMTVRMKASAAASGFLFFEERNRGGTGLSEPSTAVSWTTRWQTYTFTHTVAQATAAFLIAGFIYATATAVDIYLDGSVLLEKTNAAGAAFTGDTSGAWWAGTAHNSYSFINAGVFKADSFYTGDANNNNSVDVLLRRQGEPEYYQISQIESTLDLNRGLKRARSFVGGSYPNYNVLRNPSIETTTGWAAIGAATFTVDQDKAYSGASSGKIVVTTAAADGIESEKYGCGAAVAVSGRISVFVPVGISTELVIRAYNSSNTLIGTSTPVAGVGNGPGTGEWQHFSTTYTTPALTTGITIAVRTTTTVAGTLRADTALLSQTAWVNPYKDGFSTDAIWEGVPNLSSTGIKLTPSTSYDILHRYTDADGIFGTGTTVADMGEIHATTAAADNVFTAGVIELERTTSEIDVTLPYSGDDNDNASAIAEYKRSDLSMWTQVEAEFHRVHRHIHSHITDLAPGTSYDVRITITDTDGVYNTASGVVSTTTTTLTNFGSASGMSTVTFGGFVLMGRADGLFGVTSHDAFGLPERRLEVQNLPRLDGAIELQDFWGRRPIQMEGFISGNNRGELEDNKNALKRALAPARQRLVIDTLSNVGRYYFATCESLAIVETAGQNYTHLGWNAQFVCADPFAYDLSISSIPEFTANNTSVLALSNDGDVETDVVLNIRTQLTTPVTVSVRNDTTGQRILPSATITNGDRLVIDSEQKKVWKNGVEIDYVGGFVTLASGGNQLTFTVTTTSGTPSILCEILWQQKYL